MPNVTYTMQFTADIQQAKREMKELEQELAKIAQGTDISKYTAKTTEDLREASQAAATLRNALQQATNASTGRLDLRQFNESIKRSGQTLEELGLKMGKIGSNGSEAFADMATQIVKAEQPLKQTSKLLDSIARTVGNSIKWQLSATALYGIMDAISGAYQYAVDLDTSLNNIRIVSGQSAESMAQFAEYANQAAKNLSTTTVDYADAALIYYQQGN